MSKKTTLVIFLILIPLIVATGFTAWMSSAAEIEAANTEPMDQTNLNYWIGNDFRLTVTETEPMVYLPIINNHYCPDFEDDFSNPFSGLPVGEDSFVRYEYLDDEYRVLNKKPGFFYLFDSPSCARENYKVEVDAWWVDTPGQTYGIVFGISGDFDKYYLFDVSSDFTGYRLLLHDSGVTTKIVPEHGAPSINGGTESNHLEIIRNGSDITLMINGVELGTWSDSTISGSTRAGVFTNPYDKGPLGDARFDNFRMANLPSNNNGLGLNRSLHNLPRFPENYEDFSSLPMFEGYYPN